MTYALELLLLGLKVLGWLIVIAATIGGLTAFVLFIWWCCFMAGQERDAIHD